MKAITLLAPAKVNLFLRVFGCREDGYHNILTLMQMVGLYDRVTLSEVSTASEDGIYLTVNGATLPVDDGNIVYRAAAALQSRWAPASKRMTSGSHVRPVGAPPGVRITLNKNIPIAAGLGGGSSDAAATLIGLNELWSLRLPMKDLANIGAELGSDVPFFLYGPTAWVSGRGEKVRPIVGRPEGWMVLVHPGYSVSTRSVYDHFSQLTRLPSLHTMPGRQRPSLKLSLHTPINDLERATFDLFPHLVVHKRKLEGLGGEGVLMSGSGPTLFARFTQHQRAEEAALAMRKGGDVRTWVVESLRTSPLAL